jgi:hypothetical protein
VLQGTAAVSASPTSPFWEMARKSHRRSSRPPPLWLGGHGDAANAASLPFHIDEHPAAPTTVVGIVPTGKKCHRVPELTGFQNRQQTEKATGLPTNRRRIVPTGKQTCTRIPCTGSCCGHSKPVASLIESWKAVESEATTIKRAIVPTRKHYRPHREENGVLTGKTARPDKEANIVPTGKKRSSPQGIM